MAGDEVQTSSTKPNGGKGRGVTILIVVLIMMGEGAGIFFLAKAISPNPAPALAAEDGAAADATAPGIDGMGEIELADCRPSNKMAGRFVAFHIRVSALVSSEDVERAKEMVRSKRARVEDAVNVVIRGAEPKHLNEPGLQTSRRRLQHEFDRIFGDDELIKHVLIPQLLQSGSGV